MIVFPGSASARVGVELASALGAPLGRVELRRFPDGEGYVRLRSEVRGEDVLIVQTTYPDTRIIEALLMMSAAREHDATRVILVIPYFGYARQDKRFNEGEPVSAATIARALEAGADAVVNVDLHAASILGWFTKPAVNVTGMGEIGRYLRRFSPDFILSPDKGSVERAKTVAGVLGCPWDHLEKTRLSGSEVRMAPKELDVRGKNVVIVDDIIATGGTIVTASEQLRQQGAERIFAACTHGLFTNNALDRLRGVCDLIISTDTLENPTSVVTVAPAVAEGVREVMTRLG